MYNDNRRQAQFVSTGDPETVDDPITTQFYQTFGRGQLGAYLITQQPGPSQSGEGQNEEYRNKTYRYVETDSSMSVAPFRGAVAWWRDKSRFRVTTSPTATFRGNRAGVFQGAVTRGNACFIQTAGPATVKMVDAPASGNPYTTGGLKVIPSATAGKADTAAESAATFPTLGLTVGAGNAAAAEAIVDLDIPDTP